MMTTIAYNHKDKEIAVDGRICVDNHIVCDSFDKSVTVGDSTFFMSGSTCHYEMFAKNFENGKQDDFKYECHGIMVTDGCAYAVACNGGSFNMDKLVYNECLGSGSSYAVAAMDFGKTAKEAVEYSKTRDSATGGEVRVFKV